MEKSCKTCENQKLYKGINECHLCTDGDTHWKPKEEEKVEKLYTTFEMIEKLYENDKLEAELITGATGRRAYVKENKLYFDFSKYIFAKADLTYKWRIIEPEPQKVSFVEAFKAYLDNKVIRSIISAKSFGRIDKNLYLFIESSTPKEVEGEWIILG